MLLNVLVHVKPTMLTIVLVELILKTFTQSVSWCRAKCRRMKYTKIEGVKIEKLCMRNRQKSSQIFYNLCHRIYIEL